MRPLAFLKTSKLQEEITHETSKILNDYRDQIYFEKPLSGGKDGRYVFADDEGYHYIVCERGERMVNKLTDDLFDVKFWTIYPIVVSLSFEFASKYNLSAEEDPRVIAFPKQIEYLKEIHPNFAKRGEIEQDEILRNNPIH
ncbi:Imm63 family immunity protein [Listeria fleischmannii]|uniref:Immunity protein 63 domain-containing protein n=1 Tax=Listeria fleischmannii TaxID=1069827 RepID=A0A841YFE1_9LIST|nr:Imm63 family immunity protein [Listeria fleischmannii]MBC1398787.1 hypothetical protein [Listeria fleischmannii]MBC1426870.1 hypothetical protein [Listeria fleischmannii]